MNPKFGSQFVQQGHQHPHLDLKGAIDPTTEEGIVKGLSDFILWTPVTPVGYAAITSAMDLIGHLQQANKQITEDPYLKLRKFGEEMLRLLTPHHDGSGIAKQIFFYNYPNNEVYLGYPANLETESPPVMLKAVLGVDAVQHLTLEQAIEAAKHNTDIIQSRVFGMPLEPRTKPTQNVDWEFTLRIDHVPFESAFKVQFVYHLKKLDFIDPESVYEAFKDKYNLSRILNAGQRTQMDLRVFCVRAEVHWEWVKSE